MVKASSAYFVKSDTATSQFLQLEDSRGGSRFISDVLDNTRMLISSSAVEKVKNIVKKKDDELFEKQTQRKK